MVAIFCAGAIWICALLGLGRAIARRSLPARMASTLDEEPSLGMYGFVGLAALAAVGMAANVFLSLSPLVSLAAAGAGLTLFARNRRALALGLKRGEFFFLLLLWLYISLSIAASKTFPFDMGAYHLQAIRWATDSPTPWGLANLEGKLGFNTSWFAVAALLELPGLAGKSAFLLNPILAFFFGCAVFSSFKKTLSGHLALAHVFLTVCATALLYEAIGSPNIRAPSYDLPITLTILFVTHLLALDLEKHREPHAPLFFALALSVFALTVKMTAIPLAAGAAALAAWRLKGARSGHAAAFLRALALPYAALLLPWLVRGILLSGCPLFPLRAGCLSALPWAVPPALLTGEAAVIWDWGRLPYGIDETRVTPPWFPEGRIEDIVANWRWLAAWAIRFWEEPSGKVIVVFSALGVYLVLRTAARARRLSSKNRTFRQLALVSLAGVAFWFATAPSPRFGYGYLFSAAFLTFSFGLLRTGLRRFDPTIRRALWAGCAVWFFSGLVALVAAGILYGPYAVSWIAWPQIPQAELAEGSTHSGAKIFTPRGGVQCWRAPLPCSPILRRDVRVTYAANGLPRAFTWGGSTSRA